MNLMIFQVPSDCLRKMSMPCSCEICGGSIRLVDSQRPGQSDSGEIGRHDRFFDSQRIAITPRLVGQRAVQAVANLLVIALRESSVIVAEVGSEETANLLYIAGVEILGPFR